MNLHAFGHIVITSGGISAIPCNVTLGLLREELRHSVTLAKKVTPLGGVDRYVVNNPHGHLTPLPTYALLKITK